MYLCFVQWPEQIICADVMMFLLFKPGCHTDTIKQLLPTFSWTCASHFTNSLMACPAFPMNSPCKSTVVFSCFIYSLTAHSYSPQFIIHIVPYFLVLGHSIPLSYGTCCFYNRWQKLSVPWLPSLSLSHILLLNCAQICVHFLGSHSSGMCLFAVEITISLHLIYYCIVSKIYINHFTQKIQLTEQKLSSI